MIDRFKKRVNLIFLTSPKSQQISDFKEELLDFLMLKYNEYIDKGNLEDVSFNLAWASLSDFKEAIKTLRREAVIEKMADRIRKYLIASSIYWMIIILAYLVLSFSLSAWSWTYKIPVYGLFIYIAAIDTAGYITNKAKCNNYLASINLWLIVMPMVVLIYLIMGLDFGLWHPSWIIFIIGIFIGYLFTVMHFWKSKGRITKKIDIVSLSFLAMVILYLLISFATKGTLWSYTWLIFVIFLFFLCVFVLVDNIKEKGVIKKKACVKDKIAETDKLIENLSDNDIKLKEENEQKTTE